MVRAERIYQTRPKRENCQRSANDSVNTDRYFTDHLQNSTIRLFTRNNYNRWVRPYNALGSDYKILLGHR